jgi:phospholipid/cholesterol/gamma-HCH transport system substrate-binding protein
VFNALASRDSQLEGIIVNGERTFHAAAEGSQAFAQAIRELPAFEKNSRTALKGLDALAAVANPYFDEFKPTERKLSSLLTAAKPFVPPFDRFLTGLGPLTKAAQTGLPDVKKSLDLTTPILENLRPVLHNLDPFLQFTGQYVPELQAFFANLTAATEASGANGSTLNQGPKQHYLRTMLVFNPQSLAIYPSERVGTNRANPYFHPGAFRSLGNGGLQVFSNGACANSAPSVSGPPNEAVSQSLIELITQFKVANTPETGNVVAAPACNQQNPFTFNGQTSQFPHVTYGGKG